MKQEINRKKISIAPNAIVKYRNDLYCIKHCISPQEVIAINIKTKRYATLKATELKTASEMPLDAHSPQKDISHIDDKEYDILEKRLYGIQPLIEGKSTEEVRKHAAEIGVSLPTLYRWYRSYLNYGGIAGLFPKKRGRRVGEKMIDIRAESVIKHVIETFYLTRQRPNAQAVIRKVHTECLKRNIPLPGKNTIRSRIADIDDRIRIASRYDKKIARDKLDPAAGTFDVPYPLHTVQIDHTKMDVIVVSERDREPIGRPWVTFAVDVYSRMIHGYYLSLEPPSATSVAMCIANAVLPKNGLLAQYDIDADWEIWGFMHNVHVDNGADFRSDALKKACMLHEINIDFRPLGKTNYGGHIERLIGTVMAEAHTIPGTTFSSVAQKGGYDPEANATMTFKELERWLLLFITKVYHKRIHSAIGMTPEEKFVEGILEDKATGIPAKPENPQSIYLDFLPSFERTIQRNGVNIDGLNYYDGILRPFVHAKDKTTGKRKKFVFKRDPKDVTEVWFYNENDNGYYRIPLADQSVEHMTLYELNEIKKKLRKQREDKGGRIDEKEILMAYEELQAQIETSKQKSKKAKRNAERKHVAKAQHAHMLPKTNPPVTNALKAQEADLWDNLDAIPDFDVE